MGRRVITSQLEASDGQQVDTYFDRVIKYIPSDIVAAWTAATGIIYSQQAPGVGGAAGAPGGGTRGANTALWIAFAVGTVITAVWTWRQTSEDDKNPAVRQIIVSTLAFIVWVLALGGPFLSLDWYAQNRYVGSLILIGYTLLIGIVKPKDSAQ